LSALNSLTAMGSFVLLLLIVTGCTTLHMGVLLTFVEFFEEAGLFRHLRVTVLTRGTEGLRNLAHLRLRKTVRERDLEVDEHVAVLERVLMERQALLFNRHERVRLDDHARLALHADHFTAEVLDREINAGERLEQSDLLLHENVGAFALEYPVGLFVDDEDHVTRLAAGYLIRLAVEGVLLPMRGTLVNLARQNLAFFNHLHAFIHFPARAATFIAGLGGLAVHAWSKLYHSDDTATALADGTSHFGAVFIASLAAVSCLDAVPVDGNFGSLTVIDFF
jgi:hypothetical protein